MTKNIGTVDRAIRAAITILVIVLYYTGHITGYSGMVIRSFAALLIITAFIQYSPVYALFGISTNKNGKDEQQ